MKNMFCVLFVVFSALFAASCASTNGVMVSNSQGYKINNTQLSKRPKWATNFEDWKLKKQKENPDTFYFLGENIPDMNALEKQRRNLSEDEAAKEASIDALKQAVSFIAAEVIGEQGEPPSPLVLYFDDAYEECRFSEVWVRITKRGTTTANHCWVVYAISQKDIDRSMIKQWGY